MLPDREQCYRSIIARDPRFDGVFFTGVKTTGIYCRPVCPARTPLFKNVIFLRSAAEAQARGFRPCLRCRPELAPDRRRQGDASGLLARALQALEDGFLDQGRFGDLATHLQTSERHLRRLFKEHLGANPSQLLRSGRLRRACALLESSNLTILDTAFASGFSSLRQMQDAFRRVHGVTPSDWQRQTTPRKAGEPLSLALSYHPPLDWQGLLDFLSPRLIPGLEEIGNGRYHRRLEGDLQLSVEPARTHLKVHFQGDPPLAGLPDIGRRLRRFFDLDLNPPEMEQALGRWSVLAPHLAGLRLPGSWDPFETTVRTVLGQQVSVKAATTLCGRLLETYGRPGRFPTPQALSDAPLEESGLPSKRAQTLREISTRVLRDPLLVNDPQNLAEIAGVGPWTLGYLAMRVGAQPDAYPEGDLVLRRVLGGISASQLDAVMRDYRPWRAYATMALWRKDS